MIHPSNSVLRSVLGRGGGGGGGSIFFLEDICDKFVLGLFDTKTKQLT